MRRESRADCFCVLDDARIRRHRELGCEVKGMGRGHVRRIKDTIRRQGQTAAAGSGMVRVAGTANGLCGLR
jgi:hypothetical protein